MKVAPALDIQTHVARNVSSALDHILYKDLEGVLLLSVAVAAQLAISQADSLA
jgi:hypothetical protein